MNILTVATTNPGKIREFRLALQDLHDWSIEPLPAGILEIEESGTTFIENATLKAVHYSRFVQGLALADDSGLSVTALGNRPGVWSARYGATAEARNQRVLNELADAEASADSSNREAAFRCAIVLAESGVVVWSTEAALSGEITREPIGSAGFGFDPIFFVPKLRKTLAQLTTEEKNRWSARGQAISELRLFLSRPLNL